jgi:nitroreductase
MTQEPRRTEPSGTTHGDLPPWRIVRRFDPGRALDEPVLIAILSHASAGHSGYDQQPWRLVVLRTPKNRRRLAACCHRQVLVGEAAVVVLVLGYREPQRSYLDELIALHVQRGAISPSEGAYRRGLFRAALEQLRDPGTWAIRSAVLAAERIMAAAHARGVDSAWIEGFVEPAVRDAFGIPADHELAAIVALGYALETEAPLPRLPLSEIGFEEHFGQPSRLGDPLLDRSTRPR